MERIYDYVGTMKNRQRECDFSFVKVMVGDEYIGIEGDIYEYRSI